MAKITPSTAKGEPPGDEEVQRRMQKVGEAALSELRRRDVSEEEIQKLLARKKRRQKPRV